VYVRIAQSCLYLIVKVTEPTNTLMTYAVRLIWVVEDVKAGKSAVETLYTNLVFDKSSQSLLSGHPRPWSCPVQRGIQLLDRENIQFNEDTEEDQLVRAMVRNVATQNHALSGGGADAGLLTP
jgi:hypothetical protein